MDRRVCHTLMLFAALSGLISCEDPSEVGLSLNSDGLGIGVYVEEITLPLDNIFIDSLRTDGDNRLLVGKYIDPIFGTSISKAVTQLGLSSFTYVDRDVARKENDEFIDDYVLDSVFLQLRLSYYHSDNIGQSQTIKVVQIEDTLFSGVSYYAHFPVPVEESSLVYGESTFSINPNLAADSVIKIPLPVFGQKTIEFMRQDNAGSLSGDSLLNLLKGIALLPGENNSALLGFNPNHDTTSLKVYYHIQHIAEDTLVEDSLSIAYNFFTSTSRHFNSIKTERTNSLLLNPEKSLDPFLIDDGNAYLQSGTGVFPRLDLAPFKQFLLDQKNVIINRTDIKIPISTNRINPQYISGVEDVRFFFIEDGANIINSANARVLTNLSYLSNSAVTLSAVAADGETTLEAETSLFSQLINTDVLDVSKLLLVPTDITGFHQSIFDKSGVKMTIYYTIPK
ncbi:MAG: DUF4270 domain-containing protein [Cyclobacteriaceae bacterium]|nr:DUF4270 domain-containing protein [Cyclobacteriaceae bacterium]